MQKNLNEADYSMIMNELTKSEDYASVNHWLDFFPSITRKKYIPYFEMLIKYSGLNPDAMISLGKTNPDEIDNMLKHFYHDKLAPQEPSILKRRLVYGFLRTFFLLNQIKVFRSVYGVCKLERYFLLGMKSKLGLNVHKTPRERETSRLWDQKSYDEIIGKHKSVKCWLEKFPKEKIEQYLRYFKMLLDFTDSNPDILIEQGENDPIEIGEILNDFYYKVLVNKIESTRNRSDVFVFLRAFFLLNSVAPGDAPESYGGCLWETYHQLNMNAGLPRSTKEYNDTNMWLESSDDEIIRNYLSVRKWLKDYPLETVKKYLPYFKTFIKYSKTNPIDLLKKADEAPNEIDVLLDKYFHSRLKKYVKKINNQVEAHLFIRTFFILNKKQLDQRDTDRPHDKDGGLSYRYCFFEVYRVLGSKSLGSY